MQRVSTAKAIRMPAALAVGLAVVLAAGVSAAQGVWLVNTRQAPRSNPVGGEGRIQYSRLDDGNDWAAADLGALLAGDDPAVPTCVFLHGNRSGLSDAVRMGMGLYRELKRQAGERPFRFVIWAWPADQVRGVRQDMRLKAYRSDVQSYYLAQWLRQVHPDVSIGLIGYSFGARAITGALQLAAGGRLAGRTLPEGTTVPKRPIRVVLVAAATNSDWLLPGRANGLALGQVERLLVTRNSCDPALKWYPLMYRIGGPKAMGFTGPACLSRLGDEREKVEVVGVECSVGRNHDFSGYRRASGLRGRLGWYAFLETSEPAEQAQSPALDDTVVASSNPPAKGE